MATAVSARVSWVEAREGVHRPVARRATTKTARMGTEAGMFGGTPASDVVFSPERILSSSIPVALRSASSQRLKPPIDDEPSEPNLTSSFSRISAGSAAW